MQSPRARQGGRGSPHFFLEVQPLVPALGVRLLGGDTVEGPGRVRLGRSWHAGAVSQSALPVPEACDLEASRPGSRPLLPARCLGAGPRVGTSSGDAPGLEPRISVPGDMSWALAREEYKWNKNPFSMLSAAKFSTLARNLSGALTPWLLPEPHLSHTPAPQSPRKGGGHLPPVLPRWPGQAIGCHSTGRHSKAAVVREEQDRSGVQRQGQEGHCRGWGGEGE